MSYQVYAIENPSSHRIHGGLHSGKQIIIRGRMYEGGQSFAINLQSEEHEGCDIAFHLNPRHNENKIVRNSFEGDWAEEETGEVYHYPFAENQDFAIRILVTDSQYKVYGNGYHVVDFNHRLSYQNVHFVRVTGEAHFYDISFQDKVSSPYVGVIPGKFQVGKAVRIRGVVTDTGKDVFSLNFQCDPSGDEIAYHFNPRHSDEAVVRNSKIGGDWGDEERDIPHFPFHPGNFFDMFCVATNEGFTTFINGAFYVNFAYRCSVEQVSHMAIQGDVDIADVQYFEQTRDNVCKEIPSGLKKGDVITVRGIFQADAQSFSVNLHHENDADSDIALHYNPRRSQQQVVLNTRYGGDWGEEQVEDLPWVFRENLPFELRIISKPKKFKIYCNGRFMTQFPARESVLDIVKSVSVAGDAYIHQIKLQRQVVLPHFERIPGHINENHWISFTGTITKQSTEFSVNLQCGEDDSSDIALHFNPRIADQQVVRNSKQNGDWQDEENDQPEFPFQHKDFFEIILCVQHDTIRTFVNGRNFVNFDHRLNKDQICHVMTRGNANFFQPEFF
ncbi:uncharacterized protein LOC135469083 [Liolophura sinensis]|uniref:uncharacterized protein LOC135469083 n=1 Tax=Liolophura sinensis TaxID=3198878 RepID=UPI003159361A